MKERSSGMNTQLIAVYKRVMDVIRLRLSPTFGIRTINAIAKNSIARMQVAHPVLAHLRVGEDGIMWDELEAQAQEVPQDTLSAALESFLDEFFDLLSNLIGRLIVGRIVREAEEVLREGEEE